MRASGEASHSRLVGPRDPCALHGEKKETNIMIRSHVFGIFSSAVLLSIGATGCSADATSNDGQPGAAAAPQALPSKVIASLELEGGRSVIFREVERGTVIVEEQGPIGQKPIVDAAGKSIVDVYRELAKGAPAPASLLAAEAERVVLANTAPPADATSAPPATGTTRTAAATIHPLLTGSDTWFQSTFCSSYFSSSCVFGNDADVTTAWDAVGQSGHNSFLQNVQAYAMNAGAYASVMGISKWTGAWTVQYTSNVAVGRYGSMYAWTPGASYWQAFETRNGGDTGVDIWGFAPRFNGVTYYSNGNLVFSGEQFKNDTSVKVTVAVGSASEVVGTYAVTSPGPTTQGAFSGSSFIWCSPYGVGPYTGTLTAVGVQTGEVATTTLSLNCLP
jgi:hypothetical protein